MADIADQLKLRGLSSAAGSPLGLRAARDGQQYDYMSFLEYYGTEWGIVSWLEAFSAP